jgi:hypothetical protein
LYTSGNFPALQDEGLSAIGYEKVNQFEFAVESDVADTKEQSWDAAGTLRSAILSKTFASESQSIAATRE